MLRKPVPYLLIFLLLLTSFNGQSQVLKSESPWLQRDKLVHFSYSAGFAPAIIQVLEVKGVKHPEIIAASLMFGAGVAKEFLIDSKPRYQDIVVNLAGCVAGIYLNRFLNKIHNKNHAKKQIQPPPYTPPLESP